MRNLWLAFSIFLIPLFVLASPVEGRVISGKGNVLLAAGEVVDDDLYVAGENVVVEGVVNGDLYVAGGVVEVRGTINGDLLSVGGTILVKGTVAEDVRVLGGSILLSNAQVGDSVSLFGGSLTIDRESRVGGGLVLGGGTAVVNGQVGRGIVGSVGSLTLNGRVGKDVRVGVGQLGVGPGARIGGEVVYVSQRKVNLASRAQIGAGIKQVLPRASQGAGRGWLGLKEVGERLNLGFKVWSYLSAVLVGLVVVSLFHRSSLEIPEAILENPLRTLGWGLLMLLLPPLLFIFLIVTLIGVPLALILLALWLIEGYLSKVWVGLLLGRGFFEAFGRGEVTPYARLAVGLLIYYLVTAVPVVGFWVSTATLVFGLGAILGWKRNRLLSSRA